MKKKVVTILGLICMLALTACSHETKKDKEDVVEDVVEEIQTETNTLLDYLGERVKGQYEDESSYRIKKVFYDEHDNVICEMDYSYATKEYNLRFYDEYDNLFIIKDTMNNYFDPMQQKIYLNDDGKVAYIENELHGWKFEYDDEGRPLAWARDDNCVSGSIEYVNPDDGFSYGNEDYNNIYSIDGTQAYINTPYESGNIFESYFFDENKNVIEYRKESNINECWTIIDSYFSKTGEIENIYVNCYKEDGTNWLGDINGEQIDGELPPYFPNDDNINDYRIFYENSKVAAFARPDYAVFFLYDSQGDLDKVFDIYSNELSNTETNGKCHAYSLEMSSDVLPEDGEQIYFEPCWTEYDPNQKTKNSYQIVTDNYGKYKDVLKGQYYDKAEIIRADNKIVSFLVEENGEKKGLNFDPVTGEKVQLSTIVSDMNGLKQYVNSTYGFDIKDNWYVDRKNIYFIYNNETFKVSSNNIKELVNFENNYGQYLYLEKYKTYSFSDYDYKPFAMDIDGDGVLETVYVEEKNDEYGYVSELSLIVSKDGIEQSFIFPQIDSFYLSNVYFVNMGRGKSFIYLICGWENDYEAYQGYSFDMNKGLTQNWGDDTWMAEQTSVDADGFNETKLEYILGNTTVKIWTTIDENGAFVSHSDKRVVDLNPLTLKKDLAVEVEYFDGTKEVILPAGTKLEKAAVLADDTVLLRLVDYDDYDFREFTIQLNRGDNYRDENGEYIYGSMYDYMGIPETMLFDGIYYAG